MKSDTFAKLLVLQTLVDAEVGHLLEMGAPSIDQFRESMISRVSDLVDDIDALDAVAAARTYDAIVDFLAQTPEDDEGIVQATLRFQQAMAHIIERGMDQRERRQVSTWAVALYELLEEIAAEYAEIAPVDGAPPSARLARADALVCRALAAADRIAGELATSPAAELRSQVQSVAFAVKHRRLPPETVEPLVRRAQKTAGRHRPSPLTRIGAFVLRQVLSRDRRRRKTNVAGGVERRKRNPA